MSNMEDQMRLFETMTGQGANAGGQAPPPGPQNRPPPNINPGGHPSRPVFMPSSVRNQLVPPPPPFLRPPDLRAPGLPQTKSYTGQKEFSSPAVISKPAVPDDDEDVFSTLLKYEKEVRAEKREKKHFEKKKREMGLDSAGPGVSMLKPQPAAAPEPAQAPPTIPTIPRDISQLSAGARELAEKYKATTVRSEPDISETRKPKVAKAGTEVTPTEISLKARQMVEMVKASQVHSVEKRLAGNPLATGGMQNKVVSDQEAAAKKGKKAKKVIRVAGGQVWEDTSLLNWDSNDYRLFCGDLGNDVTDEVLTRTFSRYSSFQMAKVVRDKRSNKTKGYGFVSFKSPDDFTKAIKEMNGKYVGSRPIKLSKSNWKDRNVEVVKEKQMLKKKMGYKY